MERRTGEVRKCDRPAWLRHRAGVDASGRLMAVLGLAMVMMLLVVGRMRGATAQCANRCSGHGDCGTKGQCICKSGYSGNDCRHRTCPTAVAWADVATANGTAHATAECSNAGSCDRTTGRCTCRAGFTGMACERSKCPSDCSGNGICLSMSQAASTFDGHHLNYSTAYSLWDQDMIYGCVCDPGFSGPGCAERECEKGVDPRSNAGQVETVRLTCKCGTGCSGTFRLGFKGKKTAKIAYDASADAVADAIMALSSTRSNATVYVSDPITVTFSAGSTAVCSAARTNTTITFSRDVGDVPPLSILADDLSQTTGSPALYFETLSTLHCNCPALMQCNGTFAFVYDTFLSSSVQATANTASVQAALAGLPNLPTEDVRVTSNHSSGKVCQKGSNVATSIWMRGTLGNLPKLELLPSITKNGTRADNLLSLSDDHGTREAKVCNGIGTCDTSTGECTCPHGYTFDAAIGPCGRLEINSSQHEGLLTCPGVIDAASYQDLTYWTRGTVSAYIIGDFNGLPSKLVNITEVAAHNLTAWSTFEYTIEAVLSGHNVTGQMVRDLQQRYFYFADATTIKKFSMDANATTNISTFVTGLSSNAFGLELMLDITGRFLYFTQPGVSGTADGKIQRAALSDATLTDLTSTIGQSNLVDPIGLALDLHNSHLYWTDRNGASAGKVCRSGLTGADLLVLHENDANLVDPSGIVLVVPKRAIYIADTGSGKIYRRSYGNDTTFFNDTTNAVETRFEANLQTHTSTFYRTNAGTRTRMSIQQPLFLHIHYTEGLIFWTDIQRRGIYFTSIEPPWGKWGTHIAGETMVFSTYIPTSFAFESRRGYPTDTLYHDCYGHGTCLGLANNFRCQCDEGYFGDCQVRRCPVGEPWFDEARLDNVARTVPVECSNAGVCNRAEGTCTCAEGFEGAACERLSCPTDSSGNICSGHGRCSTMRQLALDARDSQGNPSPWVYGTDAFHPTTWDADRIQGCDCDAVGYMYANHTQGNYTGFDCSKRACRKGLNPRTSQLKTTNTSTLRGEKQNITCTATGGTFTLSFRGEATNSIAYDATAATVETELESLPTIGDVAVSRAPTSGTAVCGASVSVTVEFFTEMEDLPLIEATTTSLTGGSLSIAEIFKGHTDLIEECSGYGDCDENTGECSCFSGARSGDGWGKLGTNGDCGYADYSGFS